MAMTDDDSDDYLIPLTNIRDALLRPIGDSPIPPAKLRRLLSFHLKRLASPWQPVQPPSPLARKLISEPTFTLPGTSASFQVDSATRDAAFRVSDRLAVNEVGAYLLLRSYAMYSIDDGGELMERIELWYGQELLAIPQVVMALYHPPSESTGWEGIASEFQKEILGDREGYIESLFRGFSGIAQKRVDSLFWATLQLRQQETLLDLLFLILYQHTTRSAVVSEGLIRGALMSSFGEHQANREIWEDDTECQRISRRIRDLVIVIALESLCLSQIVAPDVHPEDFSTTLLHSRDRIHAIHQVVIEHDQPIILMAWAIALRSLGSGLLPPSGDYFHLDTTEMDESRVYVEVASRAMPGLFPWLEDVLTGPLFETTGELIQDMAALRRGPIKDLLIGLSEMINIDHLDRPSLYRVWELLFGGGPAETSASVSRNYWVVDAPFDDRRAVLDKSLWPYDPTHLPLLLSALSGVSREVNEDGIEDVFEYMNRLPFVTIPATPGTFAINNGVEAIVDIVIPGGIVPKGTRGVAIDNDVTAISWRWDQSAWPILLASLDTDNAPGLLLLRCVLQSRAKFDPAPILNIALGALHRAETATYAIDIIRLLGDHTAAASLFDSRSRRPASVFALIQADSARGEHDLTISLLRLILSLADSPAAHRVALSIWAQFSGWRYRDIAKKHQISSLLFEIFTLADVKDAFSSAMTYKPIIDELTQAVPLAKRLVQSRRWSDSDIVYQSFDRAIIFLTKLVQDLGPLPLFTVSIGKLLLVETLFDLVSDPSLQTRTVRLILRLLRTYVAKTTSLAGMLRSVDVTVTSLITLAVHADHDVKPDAWGLLAEIAAHPGCLAACMEGIPKASEEITLEHAPSLAAVLSFLQAVRPTLSNEVWDQVLKIATRFVPLPSSLSEQIERDVVAYCYGIQAKANATALLAAEIDADHVLSIVLSLFRNGGLLQEVAEAAVYSCCDPELQTAETEVAASLGINLASIVKVEREYGSQYLYDSTLDPVRKLNLNWSQLDADMALTRAFRLLAESVSEWTDDDALASNAALKASLAIASLMAKDDRGGDVMYSIQAERLEILAALLETAEPDQSLGPSLKAIIESQTLPAIDSLRHDLPPLHRPILRILLRHRIDTTFALEAADIILDNVARGKVSVDLGLVIVVLSEQTPDLLDKLQEYNIIARSLEIVVRARVDSLALHSILLLHLALANSAAEKLAVSGLLPAYADNAIALLAEQAQIEIGPVHSAWCGMLQVVKAMLASLGPLHTDVIPFIRVVGPQMTRALSWDGMLSRPALDEIELVVDVLYGAGIDDFVAPALTLLASVRHALSHPHQFSTMVVPASPEEQAALEKELEAGEVGDLDLVAKNIPVIASRTMGLVRVSRTVIMALVKCTSAWEVLVGGEGRVLESDVDPVGVLNDLFAQAAAFAERLEGSDKADAIQLAEAAALLSFAQLATRRGLIPEEDPEPAGMDVDLPKRRVSLGADPSVTALRELEGDFRGMLDVKVKSGLLERLKVAAEVME